MDYGNAEGRFNSGCCFYFQVAIHSATAPVETACQKLNSGPFAAKSDGHLYVCIIICASAALSFLKHPSVSRLSMCCLTGRPMWAPPPFRPLHTGLGYTQGSLLYLLFHGFMCLYVVILEFLS